MSDENEDEDGKETPVPTDSKTKHQSSKTNIDKTISESPAFAKFNEGLRALSTLGSSIGFNVPGVSRISDNLQEIVKLTEGFGSAAKKTIETLKEFKTRHGDAPNREENLNPLGILKGAKNLVDELAKFGETVENLLDNAKELGINIDGARKSVHDSLSILESAKEALEGWSEGDSPTDKIKQFSKLLEAFKSWPESPSIISGKGDESVAEQYDRLRKFVATFSSLMEEISDGDEKIANALKFVKKFQDDASGTFTNFADVLSGLVERLEDLSPKISAFVEKGVNQNFDLTKKRYKSLENGKSNSGESRPSYAERSHTSTSKLATDFGNKGDTEREAVEKANASVKSMSVATRGLGEGDKVQKDKNVETLPAQSVEDGPVGPLDASRWKIYKAKLAQRESGNDYGRQNTIGFSGKWQFGGPALADLGYVAPGTTTRTLKTDANVWLGKNGVNSRSDFLSNKNQCQDKAILDFTRRNYKSLLRMGVVSEGDSPDVVAGYLAAAHLKGPGGAKQLKNGRDNKDAYGTAASSYYNMMTGAVASGVPINESSAAAKRSGASEADQRRAFVGSTTVPDSPRISFPKSDSAAVRYPYNKVKTFESGHFKEYDNTPGRERIQERHRTGTGYEIDQDGSMKTTIMRDGWRAVIGSDYLMVQGHCHIMAKGDITLSAGGALNVNCQEYNLTVAGEKRETVEGSSYERIGGSRNSMTLGNEARQVDGYYKVGVAGDAQIDGGSMNLIARDGQLNAVAAKDANFYALGKANVVGKTKTNVASKGDVAVSSGRHASTSAASVGVSSDGEFGVKAGSAKIDSGSEIQVSPKVSHANHSEQSDKAAIIAPVVKPPNQSYAPPAKSDHDSKQGELGNSEFDKNVKKFDPVDGAKDQGHGNGQEGPNWDGKAYDKGVNQKIEV